MLFEGMMKKEKNRARKEGKKRTYASSSVVGDNDGFPTDRIFHKRRFPRWKQEMVVSRP